MQSTPRPLIAHFIQQYSEQHREYYESLAKHVREICDAHVTKFQYEAIVTYRAKAVNSLEKKLVERDEKQHYRDESHIKDDIKDFSGVRIALFFPHHIDLVNSFLEEEFDIEKRIDNPGHNEEGVTKETGPSQPYKNRFRGYKATHFRVALSERKNMKTKYKFDNRAEIQVMTVLQSAWAEVEHNISYKKLKGAPSFAEYQMLDGLNGLMTMGELYLEQLNTIFENRIASEKGNREPFADMYELGSFLSSQIRQKWSQEKFEVSFVDLLRKFLGLDGIKCNNKEKLDPEISRIRDTTTLTPSLQRSDRVKPNFTLVLMETMYFDPKYQLRERALDVITSCQKEKCEVLISTIITLDELYPPVAFWLGKLGYSMPEESDHRHSHGLECLKWLMSAQAPKNVILGHRNRLKPEDQSNLNDLWHWLNEHPSQALEFVFGISKLGVRRDFPCDLTILQKIFYTIKDLV